MLLVQLEAFRKEIAEFSLESREGHRGNWRAISTIVKGELSYEDQKTETAES
jgi:hypothetical protein